jgi:hypothetical protein
VVAEARGGVDAGEDCRLPRGALRAALDAEPRVRPHEHAAEGEVGRLVLKDRERRGRGAQRVERVVRPARPDAEAVHEDEKHGHGFDK